MTEESVASEDYVFRYPLQLEPESRWGSQDPLFEMLRAQLENILNLVIPVSGEKELKVDGFKLLRDRETIHKIISQKPDKRQVWEASSGVVGPTKTHYQDIKNAALYEPRIEFIKAQLESVLSAVELEKEGKRVEVDGFRLKNLGDWVVPSACDPIEVFGYAGARCDADCVFCYNRGNPPSLALGVLSRSATEEWEEMETRLKYFSPQEGSASSHPWGILTSY